MPSKGKKAKIMTCPHCGRETAYLVRHIRKYHPERGDLEQIIMDVNHKTERDRCINCGK